MTSLAIAMFLLFTGKIRWLLQGAVLAALAVTAVMTVGRDHLPEVFERRVLGTFESGDLDQAGTYEGRMALILEAVEWIDESLFLGIGVDQYRERSRFGAPVHNQYLILWTEGGTIALLGWLLILATIVVVGARGYQVRNGAPAAAATMSVATTLALVATSNTHMYGRTYIVRPGHHGRDAGRPSRPACGEIPTAARRRPDDAAPANVECRRQNYPAPSPRHARRDPLRPAPLDLAAEIQGIVVLARSRMHRQVRAPAHPAARLAGPWQRFRHTIEFVASNTVKM